jgi:hypothetical protein
MVTNSGEADSGNSGESSMDGQILGRDAQVDAEYVRRVYDRAIDWYKVAEAKAQLLLTVNGVLVTVVFGIISGRVAGGRSARVPGIETWFFLFAAISSLIGAVACAAACMWSMHGKDKTFALLGVDRNDPASYRPEVLWYFGHLARLEIGPAAALISQADRKFEIVTLSYNVVHIAPIILRKHRLVNAGWALTAMAITSLIASGASILIRAQF